VGQAPPSYADRLATLLSSDELDDVRRACQAHLGGQVVRWETTTALVQGARPRSTGADASG